jgi:hypothetical protein
MDFLLLVSGLAGAAVLGTGIVGLVFGGRTEAEDWTTTVELAVGGLIILATLGLSAIQEALRRKPPPQ